MSAPLVTIIIPCYNYGRFLMDAVKSCISQSYQNWECLIIDDGSTDDTAARGAELSASDHRVRYYYKTNGGLSSARNYGINSANGEFICFLDADDLLNPDKLREQVKCFEQFPESDVVYGKAMFFRGDSVEILYSDKSGNRNGKVIRISGKGRHLLQKLIEGNITVVSAPLIRKSVFKLVGNFDETYRSYEDWHFWIRCALKDLYFLYCGSPEVCTYIRFGHESMMSDHRKLLKAGIKLRKDVMPFLGSRAKLYNLYRLSRSAVKLAFT